MDIQEFYHFVTVPIKDNLPCEGLVTKIITEDDKSFIVKNVGDHDFMIPDFIEGPKTYEASLQIFQNIRQELNSSSSPLHTEIMEYIPSKNGTYIHNQHAVGRFFENSIDLASNFHHFGEYGIFDVGIQLKMARSLGAIHRYSRQFSTSLPHSETCQPAEVSALYMADLYLTDLTADFPATFSEEIKNNVVLQSQWDLVMGDIHGLPAVLQSATRIDVELEKVLVHGDFQLKNILISSDLFSNKCLSFSTSSLRIIDIDAGYLQSRLWDLIFLLVGGDEMYFTLGKSSEEIEANFALALEEYVKSSQQPFTEIEIALIIKMLLIRLAHLLWYFSCNISEEDKSFDYFAEIIRIWNDVLIVRGETLAERVRNFQQDF